MRCTAAFDVMLPAAASAFRQKAASSSGGKSSRTARLHALDEQVADHLVDTVLRSADLVVAVEGSRQLRVVVPSRGMREERVGFEDLLQRLGRVGGTIADLGETLQVTRDLILVPDAKDRLDVREVLVQRRPTDARLFRDLRHRDRAKPLLGDQGGGGRDDRVAHLPSVLLDRLGPEFGHERSIRDADGGYGMY